MSSHFIGSLTSAGQYCDNREDSYSMISQTKDIWRRAIPLKGQKNSLMQHTTELHLLFIS